jgi:N-acetyltransferase
MSWITPVTLEGKHVRLAPLAPEHEAGLREATSDGDVWKLWYTSVPAPDGMTAEIARRLALQAEGSMLPFTVFGAEGRIAGMTSMLSIIVWRSARPGIARACSAPRSTPNANC